ncbi:MAG: dienelactone hydrolase family protein [Firmicutes bacterium]|nr:dienelactone hydrolase family protein [Bacillota bacterium]
MISYLLICFIIVLLFIRPRRRTLKKLMADELILKKVPKNLFSEPYENMTVSNAKGECFEARFYPALSPSEKYIIILHGHNASALSSVRYLALFRELGYNCLMPSLNRCGMSDGKFISFGKEESETVRLWHSEIKRINICASVGIFGESLGGATAVIASSRIKDICFLIDYCGFASVMNVVNGFMKKFFPLFVFYFGVKLMFNMAGITHEDSPMFNAKNVTCPALIMHSKSDRMIELKNSEIIYNNLINSCDKKLKIFNGAQHGLCHTDCKEEFEAEVKAFVIKAEQTYVTKGETYE